MTQRGDPGFRDPDKSGAFDEMLSALDHFNSAPYIKAARRITYRLLRPGPGRRLLDAGCGPGFDVAALSPRMQPGGIVVGLDVSERMIAIARERYGYVKGADFRAGDIENTGFPDDYFDGVYAIRALRYLDEPSSGVRELVRITRPGGRVVLVEGGMAAVDLEDSYLTRHIFGHRGTSIGTRLPRLLRDAGLVRILVRPAFGMELGRPDPEVLAYARKATRDAVEDALVTPGEAERWLEALDRIVTSTSWFSADCMFVAAGKVRGV